MPSFQFSPRSLSLLLGMATGFSVGCVINVKEAGEPYECGESISRSHFDDDTGECVCKEGYEFCNQEDPMMDFECCAIPGYEDEASNDKNSDESGSNQSDDESGGEDASDESGGEESGDESGGEGGEDGGNEGTPPPESCSEDEEGYQYCTHLEAMGPQGSKFYICESGSWVEYADLPDESCVADGYDFSFGCVDDGEGVVFECGTGSGDPCDNNDETFCVDTDILGECIWGRTNETSCMEFCQNEGVDGIQFETGECDDPGEDSEEMADCFCYDNE